jgi:7tm Odorant receptor
MVKFQANDLSFAYYNTPWYNESLEFRKTVLSAMQSLEKPIGLNVFFYQLNNEEFGQVIKKSRNCDRRVLIFGIVCS